MSEFSFHLICISEYELQFYIINNNSSNTDGEDNAYKETRMET